MLKGGEWVGTDNLFNLGTDGWTFFFLLKGAFLIDVKRGPSAHTFRVWGGGVTEYTYSGWMRRSCGAY